MNRIKFKYDFFKLENITTRDYVELLQVLVVDKKDLTDEFIKYDTKYYDDGLKYFEIKSDKLLMLFFRQGCNLFVTLRSYSEKKEQYYKSKIGEYFKVVIG